MYRGESLIGTYHSYHTQIISYILELEREIIAYLTLFPRKFHYNLHTLHLNYPV